MSNQESITSLKNELEELKRELAAARREMEIVEQQLMLKDQHLDVILKYATVTLSAFNKNGKVELIKGKGVEVQNQKIDTNAIIGKLFQSSPEKLGKFMPNVMQAVQVAFEQNVLTYSETHGPEDIVFYTIYVPMQNDGGEVEYVYSIALRLPNEAEIDSQFYFKGEVNLDEING